MDLANKADVGVIIGRFQVPNLHAGHQELIQSVTETHSTVIILLGVAPLPNTINNPLNFTARRQMIQSAFPNVDVLYVLDNNRDEAWSLDVDKNIRAVLGPNQTAVLYGSRDSFIKHYSGIYPTLELEPKSQVSGTEIRRRIAGEIVDTEDFRKGMIVASTFRFPTAYQAVDVAIFDADFNHILLGRKPGQTEFQLPGGFSDPQMSSTLEEDAEREGGPEETGYTISVVDYIKSATIDDWRYRNEPDCVRTVLFAAVAKESIDAVDDCFAKRTDKELVEIRWFNLGRSVVEIVRPMHRNLVESALEYAQEKK